MGRNFGKALAFLVLAPLLVIGLAFATLAQGEDEKSTLVRFVEDQISSDNFHISLNGLEGTLSSDVQMSSVTIADADGIWLTITNPRMIWTRTALLTGTVDIDSLTAESIDYVRNPLPDESLPDPEANPFSIPELPVSLTLEKLSVGTVTFGEPVFGLASQASLDGSLKLAGGALDLKLDISRLDGAGGELSAIASYETESENLKLDVQLREPENGMIANALNIKDRPPVSLSMTGNAPVSELEVALGFDVAQNRILTGKLSLSGQAEGLTARASLSGPLSRILPDEHKPFFGATSNLNGLVLFEKGGAIDVRSMTLKSGSIDMQATAYQLADGFLQALDTSLKLRPNGTDRVLLPAAEGETSLSSGDLTIRYDATRSNNWNARLFARNIQRDTVRIAQTELNANGSLSNLTSPESRATSFELVGLIDGFDSAEPGLSDAIGRTVRLYGTGNWQAGEPTEIAAVRVNGKTFNLTSSGILNDLTYTGTTSLSASDLAAFSTLTDRALSGQASVRASGDYTLSSNAFDLTLDGTTNDLSVDDAALDALLAGETTLSGSAARGEDGISFETLRIANSQFETNLDGQFASNRANLSGNGLLRDLRTLSEDANGAVSLMLAVSGNAEPFNVQTEITMPNGTLQGRLVENLTAAFNGTTNRKSLRGSFSGGGRVDNKPVSLTAELDVNEAEISLQSLVAQITDTMIKGNFRRASGGLMQGWLEIESSDIGDVAALGLVDASGQVTGRADLFNTDSLQTVKADLSISQFQYDEYRVGSGTLVATAMDIFNRPRIGATLNGEAISAGGTTIDRLQAKIGTTGQNSEFDATASLPQNNTKIETNGTLIQQNGINTVTLNTLLLNSDVANAQLQAPATITMREGMTRISDIVLAIGSGVARISGSASEQLDLVIDLNSISTSIVNAFAPNMRAGGSVSGTVRVTGKPAKPIAQFELDGTGMTAAALQEAGISPVRLTASGQYGEDVVQIEGLQISNPQKISVRATGVVPLESNGMDLQASGTLPLSLASASLAERGASVTGNATFDTRVTGSINNPNMNGNIRISDASYTDPLANLRLVGISLQANLTGKRLVIDNGQARLSGGGSVRLGGSVALTDNLPASINISLTDARYTDGETFSTSASGTLRVDGTLLRDPILAGTITLGNTEITVPESFAGDADLLDVTHIEPDAKTNETLARRDRATPAPEAGSRPSLMRLDITVDAPNQIFVRGRGLDAELGGSIRVRGPVNDVQPIGRFELRRGRLSILGKRIDLNEGTISLTGDLDPVINFVAQTSAEDVDAFIRIQGRVSDVDVTFTSSPEFPQDEVLALIIFGRGINDLSPVQIARLASIAAELTGGNSPGLVDGIRRGAGLDDLDVVEDDDGNAAVRAGKYVSDNVYLGVEAGQRNTEATVNLDITDNVTARGGVSSDGETSLGIFLEKDY